jgi:hypothetical protein
LEELGSPPSVDASRWFRALFLRRLRAEIRHGI